MGHPRRIRGWLAIGATAGLLLVGCGGDDDAADSGSDAAETAEATDDGSDAGGDADAGTADAGGDEASDDAAGDDAAGDDAAADDAGAPSGGGAGTLVLGDETITLDSARCYLQEQDAAAGGGKILFVAQGFGTNAAGEELVLDVSRYDEDSQFTGDDVNVDIGDPFGDDAVSLRALADLGTVQVDGRNLSADGLTFSDVEAGVDMAGSFEINC